LIHPLILGTGAPATRAEAGALGIGDHFKLGGPQRRELLAAVAAAQLGAGDCGQTAAARSNPLPRAPIVHYQRKRFRGDR